MNPSLLPLFASLSALACVSSGCITSQEARLDAREEVVGRQMGGHLGEARLARDAVVAGDLAAAQAALKTLRGRLPLGSMAPQQARLEAVFIQKVEAAQATSDLPAMGEALGQLAQACGDCHLTAGLELPVEAELDAPGAAEPPTPAPPVTVAAGMDGHMWATAQMWAALVAGDDAAFQEGAEAMGRSSLVPSGLPADAPVPPLAAELEVRAQDLAALAARSDSMRGQHLGQMLGTCAQCHQLLGKGPR